MTPCEYLERAKKFSVLGCHLAAAREYRHIGMHHESDSEIDQYLIKNPEMTNPKRYLD